MIAQDAAVAREKRKRSGGSRSRSGCNTCKIRRVKCDEQRPGCMRCQKFGRECDGYEHIRKSPSKRKSTSNSVTRKGSPIPATLKGETYQSRVAITVSSQDTQEDYYMRFFQEETAEALSGGFDNLLWSHIVLEACNNEPCILHCAVALAALDKSCRAETTKYPGTSSENHHQYALRCYDKAIREVREVSRNRKDALRTILISSLLIFCFETFHGDIRLALNNIQGAIELLYAWLSNQNKIAAPGQFSPLPAVIEDDLVSAYARIDIHLLSWIDAPLPSRGKISSFATTETVEIPNSFESFVEAKIIFDQITNNIFQYLELVHWIKAQASQGSTPSSQLSENTIAAEPKALRQLRQWMKAFEVVLESARTHGEEQVHLGAITLQIHAITLDIVIHSAPFETTNPHAYDIFLPEFCELVALSNALVNHPTLLKPFVFNVGFVASLFIVVMKCKDKMVRQEAVDVLKAAAPRREGVWDCLMVARIGEELIKSEEVEKISGLTKESIEIHISCLNMRFELPRPPRKLEDLEMEGDRAGGRGYLLDWVERCVNMDIVAGP